QASDLGIDVVRGIRAWQIQLVDTKNQDTYRATLDARTNQVLNLSDDTPRYGDAKVSRWKYNDSSNLQKPDAVVSTGIYTQDDNTLVHDFFDIVNDDRNDGGDGECTLTKSSQTGQVWSTRSTPGAYTSAKSSTHIRPTRRSDRDFS